MGESLFLFYRHLEAARIRRCVAFSAVLSARTGSLNFLALTLTLLALSPTLKGSW